MITLSYIMIAVLAVLAVLALIHPAYLVTVMFALPASDDTTTASTVEPLAGSASKLCTMEVWEGRVLDELSMATALRVSSVAMGTETVTVDGDKGMADWYSAHNPNAGQHPIACLASAHSAYLYAYRSTGYPRARLDYLTAVNALAEAMRAPIVNC